MSTTELGMWAVALAIGVPSAWRNPTAAALVLSFVFSNLVYVFTGNGLAVEAYLFPDIAVIAIIFCKKNHRDYPLQGGDWHQLKCLWLERSPADRIVLSIFPLMWIGYVADVDPYYKYWALYWLAIIQFLAAGVEGFLKLTRRARAASETLAPPGDVFRRLAWGVGSG